MQESCFFSEFPLIYDKIEYGERVAMMYDICIIGGGASGMAAAIAAKEENPSLKILITEKKNQLGKKILATGNGRCNLSNAACPGSSQTLAFFEHLGVLTRTDRDGRIYPYTEDARTVRDALEQRLRQLGVEVMTSSEVSAVEKEENFMIRLGNRLPEAKKVLIACGGKAGSAFGTTGDGFRFAKQLGHRVEKPVPVLTAVDVKEDMTKLSGIRVKAKVRLRHRGRTVFSEEGEVQFTAAGLSGICVFNLSRYLLLPPGTTMENGFDDYEILLDFFPEREDVRPLLETRRACGFERERLLQFLLRRPLAELIYQESEGDVDKTAILLKAFPFHPRGVRGWDFAQATKGGVNLEEINMGTMESRLIQGLYFAGEVIDYDGPCGGYNLQNAWETGLRAGKEMAR